jgi:hypothetical protein
LALGRLERELAAPIFHVPQVLLFGVAAWLAAQVLFT